MRKYDTWANLNAEGKKHWGDIFPDGVVPVKSIIEIPARLKGVSGTEKVYMVDWKELTKQQQDAILEKLNKCSGAPKDEILKEILKVGLPLREKYTSGSGTTRTELFT